jgi:3-hydroxyisobutyrate dehydrogenase
MKQIAFLGMGAMGSLMAANLIKTGYPVTVWNRDTAKSTALVEQGAKLAQTPFEAALEADYVFSMVTDNSAARSVWLDEKTGAVHALREGAVAIECSTTSPSWVKQLNKAVNDRGANLLDAPVAGSRPQAATAQLIFMVGGNIESFELAEPILKVLGSKVLHVGAIGQGSMFKLAVNTLFAAQLQSAAELLGLLTKNGYQAEYAAELMGEFPIVAAPIAGALKMMATKNTSPMFTIDLIEKDLGYVIEVAATSHAEVPGALTARSSFQRAQELGLGSRNISALAAAFD